MSKKEGIVIDTNGKYANLLTPYGEFIRVNCNGKKPNIGEKFVGNEAVHRFFPVSAKKILIAACIAFALVVCGAARVYYSPSATVLVNINPRIELKVNSLNRIISSKALNDDGRKVLNQIKINNIDVNDGLRMILYQSRKDKLIDRKYMKAKSISINISGKNLDISKFKSDIKTSDLNVKIKSNGNVILNKNLVKEPDKSVGRSLNYSPAKNVKSVDSNIDGRTDDKYLNSKSNYKSSNSTYNRKNSVHSNYSPSPSKKNVRVKFVPKRPQIQPNHYSNKNSIKVNQAPRAPRKNFNSGKSRFNRSNSSWHGSDSHMGKNR
ncbi:MAG TPA: hypothetical protein DC034_06360 [Clostridium sp.]|jgi:hypothetical protein|nr:anti-sigma factor domain-containing protein [Clostridiales bacterium]HBC96402.1 hypothetical protein [Clostridium sp.]